MANYRKVESGGMGARKNARVELVQQRSRLKMICWLPTTWESALQVTGSTECLPVLACPARLPRDASGTQHASKQNRSRASL